MPDTIETRIINTVMSRINTARQKRLRIRMGIQGVLGLFTLIAIFPAINQLGTAIKNSSVLEYLSLIISDGSTALNNWKALVISIAESLPLIETSIVLIILLIGINILRHANRDVGYYKMLTVNN